MTIFGLRHVLDQYQVSNNAILRRADLEPLYINLKALQHPAGGDLKRPRPHHSPRSLEKPPPIWARPTWLVQRQHAKEPPLNLKEKPTNVPHEPPRRRSARIDAAQKASGDSSRPITPTRIIGKRTTRVPEDNLPKDDTPRSHKRPRHILRFKVPRRPRARRPKRKKRIRATKAQDRPSTQEHSGIPSSDFTCNVEMPVEKAQGQTTPDSTQSECTPPPVTTCGAGNHPDNGKDQALPDKYLSIETPSIKYPGDSNNVDAISTAMSSCPDKTLAVASSPPHDSYSAEITRSPSSKNTVKKILVPHDYLEKSMLTLVAQSGLIK
ncbi:uncharacterized protein PGTG_21615 [Puccinia graminis f. sp. tritici CRL 75-36-700-3]|uniref:Uncharacterized protein n=1 Tax=Puccinia graminis f. sp. tritici (strain CRL 75-36-700-3 / race SCCL) TaxID=418459 RepID=H6QS18_PUCGT|nr:uncharacterized protein PGTG_21615 [Puccinia graminis f. sp. tritici CRL 75-36-700-3]EHS63489.1 hypothetical protein PGTG_21615 [Puccinia graminis f. sp. tritici CRL 75-36-700-3]